MRDSSISQVYDAVHGSVDLNSIVGVGDTFIATIEKLLASSEMQRLKRIKQLGFVSRNFLSASHDRFTHSIGTMVTAERMFERLKSTKAFARPECPVLEACKEAFPAASWGAESETNCLKRHLLVAALIQDVGELPYNTATSPVCRLNRTLIERLRQNLHVSVDGLEFKKAMTLVILEHWDRAGLLEDLDVAFLAFLASGRLALGTVEAPGLTALRHMLDGPVDADRLDYVFRDAFHTLGIKRSPEDIIGGLLYYDECGPVFESASGVADFFATRAMLWSSVYLNPACRFRNLLLGLVMDDLVASQAAGASPASLRIDWREIREADFGLLTDDAIDKMVAEVAVTNSFQSARAQAAAEVLLEDGSSYTHYWLAAPEGEAPGRTLRLDDVPTHMFWDTYTDYQAHMLYTRSSVRVQVDSYKYISPLRDLEDCSGPFNIMLKEQVSGLPMPGHVTVFCKRNGGDAATKRVMGQAPSGKLYRAIVADLGRGWAGLRLDTRLDPDFTGDPLFLSFCFEDEAIAIEICRELERQKQRYFCLAGPMAGLGKTPRQNSVEAVESVRRVILLYSPAYADRYQSPDGNIAAEVNAMIRAVGNHSQSIYVVSTVSFEQLEGTLPWTDLGFSDGRVPMVGPPLTTPGSVVEAVKQIVAR